MAEKKAVVTEAEEEKIVALTDVMDALDAALREHGRSLPDLVAAVAAKEWGIDLRRVVHPIEAPKE